MTYTFDQAPSRLHTGSTKWDRYESRYGLTDVIPLWVADMDFACLPEVSEAITRRAQHPVFGYSDPPAELYKAVIDWERRQHGIEVTREQLVWNTGVVYGLYGLIELLVQPEEKVLVQLPAYPPFFNTPKSLGRGMVFTELRTPKAERGAAVDGVLSTGVGSISTSVGAPAWAMDLDDIERKLSEDPAIRMFVLCNPHNPTGHCWTRNELESVLEVCARHDVWVISDEIHADIVAPGHTHISALACDERFRRRLVVLGAPTKTFNLAGLKLSYAIVPDDELQRRFAAQAKASGLSSLNIFGVEATIAAYTHGDAWKDACVAYVHENLVHLQEIVQTRMGGAQVTGGSDPRSDKAFGDGAYAGTMHRHGAHMDLPEATYLGWIDFRELGLPANFCERLKYEARVELQAGSGFGAAWSGWGRVNCACPRTTLDEGLQRVVGWLEGNGFIG